MPIPKPSFFFANSSYIGTSNTENLSITGESYSFGKYGTISFGGGVDQKYDYKKGSYSYNPAFEAKYKLNIGNHLNTQVRFREIGGTEQLRATFGGSYKFNDKNSIYTSAHITTKNNSGDIKTNTGLWVGYTHNFDNGMSISGEFQQNVPLNSTTDIEETLNSWDDGNKSFNVILSVPLCNKQKAPEIIDSEAPLL
jgi:hypothetical protein